MLWVVQNNLYHEAGYQKFLDAVERLGVKYQIVKVVPFTNKLLPADFDSMKEDFEKAEEPYIDPNQKIMIMGAISLCRISKEKGWTPGSYLNENFDFEIWRDGFGEENVLNSDAVVGTIDDIEVPFDWDWRFVRPVHDTKSISGTVMSKNNFQEWRLSINVFQEQDGVHLPLHKYTKIMVSTTKKIFTEYRMFVVDGKVVTGAQYKSGNTVMLCYEEPVEPRVVDFTQEMVDRWKPAKAFVIDIADTPHGLKVIEINNINSAGFYGSDVQKLVMALEDLEER